MNIPQIVKELREEEKLGLLKNNSNISKTLGQSDYILQELNDNINKNKNEIDTLITNEEKFRKFFENEPEFCYIIDFKGTIQDINSSALKTLGYEKGEIIGKPLMTIYAPISQEKAKLLFNKWKEIGTLENEKLKIITKTGETRDILLSAGSIKDSNGNIIYSVSVQRDITDISKAKKVIEEREAEYKNLFDTIPDGIITVNKKGSVTSCNPAFLKLTGYNEDEIVGKHIARLPSVTLKSFPKSINLLNLFLKGKLPQAYEFEWKHKNGSIRLGKAQSRIIIKDGKEEGFLAVIHDITDLRKSEQTLRENELRYNSLFDNSQDMIYINDFKGNFIDANEACFNLLGYTRDEIKNINYKKLLNKQQLFKALNIISEIKKNGIQNKPAEFSLRCKNGSFIDVETTSSIIYENGKPIALQGIARDITKRKKDDKILRNNEEKYRMIFNNVNDEIVYLNSKGIILDVNPRSKDIFGYSPKELIGKKFSEIGFFKGKNLMQNLKLFKKIAIDKKPLSLKNHEILDKNGSIIFADVIVKPILQGSKLKGIVVIVRDNTEQKKAEDERKNAQMLLKKMNEELETKFIERTFEVERLLNQKDEFINQLGHDLKNPLNPLVNLLPIIENTEKNSEMKEVLHVINRNVGFMKNLVIKTIELAKLNSTKTEFKFENINLLSETNQVININNIMFADKEIQVINNIPNDIVVKADKIRLEELITNLLSNSLKYSKRASKIIIDAKPEFNFVTVSVNDEGIGMNSEQLSHIFNEFYKADTSRHDFDSTGLGLSICKRIVEIHGGQIWAESKGKGKGSTFYFTLRSQTKKTSELKLKNPKRISVINHKDKEIVYLDYSNLKDDEHENASDDIMNFVTHHKKFDLLVLTNVDGNFFNLNQIKNTKKAGRIIKPYLKKNAIIGISKNQNVFLKAVKLFSGIELKYFENIEKAKDWLVE